MNTLSQRDQKHLWHPLTQHQTANEALAIKSAAGCLLIDENGNEYIDAISSWYTAVYGHCNPYITGKVAKQMQQLDQVVFTGFTHQPAVELSEKLIDILPKNQEKLFFSDNGSTSVEVAIKMALQFHYNNSEKRTTLLALENGFHGDTFGAMSVSGLSVYNGPFEDHFLKVKRIPSPTSQNIGEVLERIRNLHQSDPIAALVYEPLVQGAAAMHMYDAEELDKVLQFCDDQGIITIADEVMTGFGKTGSFFASDQLSSKPDIICLSKALTAGLLPMGITSCCEKIYKAFLGDDIKRGFFHGHTYSANPLACTAAIAGIELLQSNEIQNCIKRTSTKNEEFVAKFKNHPKIESARTKGVILALDLKTSMSRYGKERNKLYDFFMSKGVYLRPLGNTIYIVPPYVISEKQLQKVYDVIEEAIIKF